MIFIKLDQDKNLLTKCNYDFEILKNKIKELIKDTKFQLISIGNVKNIEGNKEISLGFEDEEVKDLTTEEKKNSLSLILNDWLNPTETKNKIDGLEVLDELLQKYKKGEMKNYTSLKNEYDSYINKYNNAKKEQGKDTKKWSKELIQMHNYMFGTDNYWEDRNIKGYEKQLIQFSTIEEIEEEIDKDVEFQYKRFIYKIEEKGGKIVKVINCGWNQKGDIDGRIKCKNEIIVLKAILAGGYNVQRLHWRTLVKVYKSKVAK